jgi:pimeloyl-ACP methyl ester carboxylesterase
MARFVFVHGAFMGAWCWDEVAALLRARGHRADVPDLPGAGEDPTPPGEVTLESCVARVCAVLARGEPAILVGHSLGGVTVTAAAARCGRHVARLVYIAAFVPAHGQTGRLAGEPLIVDDLDETLRLLRQHGAEVLDAPVPVPTGTMVYVRHADGTRVEYLQFTPDLVERVIGEPASAAAG